MTIYMSGVVMPLCWFSATAEVQVTEQRPAIVQALSCYRSGIVMLALPRRNNRGRCYP